MPFFCSLALTSWAKQVTWPPAMSNGWVSTNVSSSTTVSLTVSLTVSSDVSLTVSLTVSSDVSLTVSLTVSSDVCSDVSLTVSSDVTTLIVTRLLFLNHNPPVTSPSCNGSGYHSNCLVSTANCEDISGFSSTLQAAAVSHRHLRVDAALPRCFAAARSPGAWATLQLPVHRPANHVICSACQPVEIWRECVMCSQSRESENVIFILYKLYLFFYLPVWSVYCHLFLSCCLSAWLPIGCWAERLRATWAARRRPAIGQSGHPIRRRDPSALPVPPPRLHHPSGWGHITWLHLVIRI